MCLMCLAKKERGNVTESDEAMSQTPGTNTLVNNIKIARKWMQMDADSLPQYMCYSEIIQT